MEEKSNDIKNKYNNGNPMSIEEMKHEEVEEAIHAWAEGSENLEKVLKESYKHGFYSLACCAGGGGEHSVFSYLAFDLNNDRDRKIAVYIAQKLLESQIDCKISFDDNSLLNEAFPESYPTFEITRFSIETLLENREETYGKMFEILSELEKVDLDKIELPSNGNKKINQDFKFRNLVEKAIRENPEIIREVLEVDGIWIKDKSELEKVEWNLDDWE